MSYLDPDITGASPDCFVDNYQLCVYSSEQIIEFDVPVYWDSLHIFKTGTDIELEKDTDYSIKEVDQTSIASIKYAHPDFDKLLVKSIVIHNPSAEEFDITLKFQQLYPNMLNYYYYRGTSQLEFTPELLIEMLDRIQQIEYTLKTTFNPNTFTPQSLEQIKIAELDINKSNPDNLIQDEIHHINTINDIVYISPTYGSFFKDSVSIIVADTGVPLEENKDYEIMGLNVQKTKVTTNPSGVYDFIKITKELVGNVKVTYHAFGGLPSLSNFKDMYDKLFNVLQYLSGNQLVSVDMVPTLPDIVSLKNKVYELEDKMRNLLSYGTPTYGDITFGTSTRKKITAVNNNLNWWTIASLYKVEGSDEIVLKDIFKFHIEFLNSGINLEGSVLVDLTKDDPNEQFRVVITNNNERPNMAQYKLHFRIVYNKTAGTYSGVLLQIGIALNDYLNDTIAIEDLSGKESCWLLIAPPQSAVNPENDNLLLPDGSSYWVSTDDSSHQISTLAPLATGADLITQSVTVIPNQSSLQSLTNLTTDISDYLIKNIKAIEFHFALHENGNTSCFTTKLPAKYLNVSEAMCYINDIVKFLDDREYNINFQLSKSTQGIRIASQSSYASDPQFDLQRLKIFM